MPGAYPLELRERVIEAHDNGEGTYEELAERFKVGRATVNRWLSRVRWTGSVDSKPMGGARHPRKVDETGEHLIRELLEVLPDSTLGELVTAYETEFGIRMHERTMGRSVNRMGFTRKRGPSDQRARTALTSSSSARDSSIGWATSTRPSSSSSTSPDSGRPCTGTTVGRPRARSP